MTLKQQIHSSCILAFALGGLELTASDLGLVSIRYVADAGKKPSGPDNNPTLILARKELHSYFKGDLKSFSIPLDDSGHPAFYLEVWKEVGKIPYGLTQSYMDIAKKLDNPGAVRAVGLANGKNPWPIVVPCHRVVGSNGSLTGYAYGLEMKQWLLEWEWAHRNPPAGSLF